MKLIKIYCGRNTKAGTFVSMKSISEFIKSEVATQYEGFTVYHTLGYWQGKEEISFVIEIITEPGPLSHHVDFRPQQIANAYKRNFDQEAVLVTIQEIEILE